MCVDMCANDCGKVTSHASGVCGACRMAEIKDSTPSPSDSMSEAEVWEDVNAADKGIKPEDVDSPEITDFSGFRPVSETHPRIVDAYEADKLRLAKRHRNNQGK